MKLLTNKFHPSILLIQKHLEKHDIVSFKNKKINNIDLKKATANTAFLLKF